MKKLGNGPPVQSCDWLIAQDLSRCSYHHKVLRKQDKKLHSKPWELTERMPFFPNSLQAVLPSLPAIIRMPQEVHSLPWWACFPQNEWCSCCSLSCAYFYSLHKILEFKERRPFLTHHFKKEKTMFVRLMLSQNSKCQSLVSRRGYWSRRYQPRRWKT